VIYPIMVHVELVHLEIDGPSQASRERRRSRPELRQVPEPDTASVTAKQHEGFRTDLSHIT
jgi:hypothetical protein